MILLRFIAYGNIGITYFGFNDAQDNDLNFTIVPCACEEENHMGYFELNTIINEIPSLSLIE